MYIVYYVGMKTALLIGRFQPFHFGHLYLIRRALAASDRLIIGIGSSNMTNVKNPLSWRLRKKMLERVIKEEKLDGKIKKIIPLKDFFNDEKWLNNVLKRTGGFDFAVGNNDWVNRIMKKGRKEVMTVPYYKRYLYEGEKIRGLISNAKPWESRVPGYLIGDIKRELEKIRYKHVIIGGTFDHFHQGHRILIEKAFKKGTRVTIGVATKKIFEKKFLSETIESYETRKKSVTDFLSNKDLLKRAKIISFSNFKANADIRTDIDAVVVSRITYGNALKINDLRAKNKLDHLNIIVIDNILAEDNKLLSSERIRAGEIGRDGENYLGRFKKTLLLPKSLRKNLRQPLGKVFKETGRLIKFVRRLNPVMTIAVGDIISQKIEQRQFIPDVKIIDFRSRRHSIYAPSSSTGRTINRAGTVNSQSVKSIDSAIKKTLLTKKPKTVAILGEEDLLALPAIILAPLNSLVLYGQWNMGVVAVYVTEEIKYKIIKLLKKFD